MRLRRPTQPGRQVAGSAEANEDQFVIDTGPNFEIIGSAADPNPADVFHAFEPPAGHDSSTFVIVAEESQPGLLRPDPRFKLPQGFAAVPDAGHSPDGLPLVIRGERDGGEMALVAAGVSALGTDAGPPDARPRLEVYLDAFYVDVTEVTVERYGRFLQAARRSSPRALDPPLNQSAGPGDPALGVAWADARDYAAWAGKELPTEAQWEKAGRGPAGFAHPWGNGRAVWSRARTPEQIDPVGSFPLDRSPYGVLDLAGNAREWVLDHYSNRAFEEAAAGTDGPLENWTGPRRPSIANQRVVKGNGSDWSLWHRQGVNIRERAPHVGFRCVLNLPAANEEPSQAGTDTPDGDAGRTRRRNDRGQP